MDDVEEIDDDDGGGGGGGGGATTVPDADESSSDEDDDVTAPSTTTTAAAAAAAKTRKSSLDEYSTLGADEALPSKMMSRIAACTQKSVNVRCRSLMGALARDNVKIDSVEHKRLYSCTHIMNASNNYVELYTIIDHVWQRASCLSGQRIAPCQMRLVKWDPEGPMTFDNLVLMSQNETMPHNKSIKVAREKAPYEAVIMEHVAARARLINDLAAAQQLPDYTHARTWRSLLEIRLFDDAVSDAPPLHTLRLPSVFATQRAKSVADAAASAKLALRTQKIAAAAARQMEEAAAASSKIKSKKRVYSDDDDDETTMTSDDDPDDTGSDLEEFIENDRPRHRSARAHSDSDSGSGSGSDSDSDSDSGSGSDSGSDSDSDAHNDDEAAAAAPRRKRASRVTTTASGVDGVLARLREDVNLSVERCFARVSKQLRGYALVDMRAPSKRARHANAESAASVLLGSTELGNTLRTLLASAVATLAIAAPPPPPPPPPPTETPDADLSDW